MALYRAIGHIQNTPWRIINAGIHWRNCFVRLSDNAPMGHVMAIATR